MQKGKKRAVKSYFPAVESFNYDAVSNEAN